MTVLHNNIVTTIIERLIRFNRVTCWRIFVTSDVERIFTDQILVVGRSPFHYEHAGRRYRIEANNETAQTVVRKNRIIGSFERYEGGVRSQDCPTRRCSWGKFDANARCGRNNMEVIYRSCGEMAIQHSEIEAAILQGTDADGVTLRLRYITENGNRISAKHLSIERAFPDDLNLHRRGDNSVNAEFETGKILS